MLAQVGDPAAERAAVPLHPIKEELGSIATGEAGLVPAGGLMAVDRAGDTMPRDVVDGDADMPGLGDRVAKPDQASAG